jgi:spoIIIJ-associated protein
MDGALFVDDDERSPRRTERVDDLKADDARRVTQGILDRMELDARVSIREDDETVVLDISGEDAGRAIGKKGMTLEALQFLVNKIINRDPDDRRHIVLDSGNYRERHDNGLIAMAKREAKRASQLGKIITLEPMSARDRRVVHVALAQFSGVSTRSEGEGTERRLQIIPARTDGAPARGGRGGRDRGPRRGGGGGGGGGGSGPGLRDRNPSPVRTARDEQRTSDDSFRDERPSDDRYRDDRD